MTYVVMTNRCQLEFNDVFKAFKAARKHRVCWVRNANGDCFRADNGKLRTSKQEMVSFN